MKRKKDIFDLMRENQHKLDESPSPRTWQRLESKLDARHNKNRTFLYKQLAMAAAVVALVAVVSLFSILVNQQNRQQMAMADKSSSPWIVKDLEPIYTDIDLNLRKVVEFQLSLKNRYANPISEGTQAKKLLAANTTATLNAGPKKPVSDAIVAFDNSDISTNFTFSKTDATNNDSEIAYNENVAPEVTRNFEVVAEESAPLDEISESENTTYNSKTIATDAMPAPAMKKEYAAMDNTALLPISNFEWLIGKWSDTSNEVVREWKKVSDSQLISKIYSADGKTPSDTPTTFLRIKGNDWFYYEPNLNRNILVGFKLKTHSKNELVFENNESDFPTQITIKRTGNNSLNITYTGKDGKDNTTQFVKTN